MERWLRILLIIILLNFIQAADVKFFPEKHLKERLVNIIEWKENVYLKENGDIDVRIGIEFYFNEKNLFDNTSPIIKITPTDNIYFTGEVEIPEIYWSPCRFYECSSDKIDFKKNDNCPISKLKKLKIENSTIRIIDGKEKITKRYDYFLDINRSDIEDTTYSLLIKYKVKNFLVKQGDYMVYMSLDEANNDVEKTVILPEDKMIIGYPEDSIIHLDKTKRWKVFFHNIKGFYFISYEEKPWYQNLSWIIVVAILGSIIGGISVRFFGRKLKKK